MRTLVSIILMLSLVYQCTVQLGILAWYNVNMDYIARNLCENRDKPQTNCNGRCQLSKQLNKTSEGQDHSSGKQLPSKNNQVEITDLLVSGEMTLVLHQITTTHPIFNPVVPHMFGYAPVTSVFHPPAC